MGVLDRLFNFSAEKEATKAISGSLNEFHQHLSYHRMWINYLHENIKQLHQNAGDLHSNHNYHKEEIRKSIENMGLWVDHLYQNQKRMEKDIRQLEESLKKTIKTDLEKYHKEILETIKGLNTPFDYDLIKKDILEEIKPTEKVQIVSNRDLTGPEKELVTFLFNQNTPLTYDEISAKTKKSINSVRVYMNSLKEKKDIVEEYKQPNGIKIFGIKNKEKTKLLYNLP